MKKWKVTIWVMLDPSKGDQTKALYFDVEADEKISAYTKAEKELDEKYPTTYARLSVFNYKVEEQ